MELKTIRGGRGRAVVAAVTTVAGAAVLGTLLGAQASGNGTGATARAAAPSHSAASSPAGEEAKGGTKGEVRGGAKSRAKGSGTKGHARGRTEGAAEGAAKGAAKGGASTSSSPIPGETSVANPSLPAPRVSMDIAHASDAGAHAVDITIDDGPDPVWTPKVLKVLRDNHVKAVFCMIGENAAKHPDLVKQVVAEGHLLCDHSVHHDTAMDEKPESFQRSEVVNAARMIERASGGVKPLYYRAPGGSFTPYSRQIAASMGMRPLGWNVDTKDFERPGVPSILNTVDRELPDGPTILFHDGGGDRSQTVKALSGLLPRLRQQGYSFGFPVR